MIYYLSLTVYVLLTLSTCNKSSDSLRKSALGGGGGATDTTTVRFITGTIKPLQTLSLESGCNETGGARANRSNIHETLGHLICLFRGQCAALSLIL